MHVSSTVCVEAGAVFCNGVRKILGEGAAALETVLIEKWHVPSAIIGEIKVFWLDVEVERERSDDIGRMMNVIEWHRNRHLAPMNRTREKDHWTYGKCHAFDRVWWTKSERVIIR